MLCGTLFWTTTGIGSCACHLREIGGLPYPGMKLQDAVVHNGGWKDQQINETYQELAEHYGTAIIPVRVRAPKEGKPNAEGTVGNISTWITAALRNEQFFSLAELNRAIRDQSFFIREGANTEIWYFRKLMISVNF